MMRLLLPCLLLLSLNVQAAQEIEGALKPFQRGSATAIVEARTGKPFILAFWSVECVHCRSELEQLSGLLKRHAQLDVVLVSTDDASASGEVQAVLRQYDLARAERWVFADDFIERLRFEVDPRWRGELPRSYLYGPGKTVDRISGKLDDQRLASWLKRALSEPRHDRD